MNVNNSGPSTIRNGILNLYLPSSDMAITGELTYLYPYLIRIPVNVSRGTLIAWFETACVCQGCVEGGARGVIRPPPPWEQFRPPDSLIGICTMTSPPPPLHFSFTPSDPKSWMQLCVCFLTLRGPAHKFLHSGYFSKLIYILYDYSTS